MGQFPFSYAYFLAKSLFAFLGCCIFFLILISFYFLSSSILLVIQLKMKHSFALLKIVSRWRRRISKLLSCFSDQKATMTQKCISREDLLQFTEEKISDVPVLRYLCQNYGLSLHLIPHKLLLELDFCLCTKLKLTWSCLCFHKFPK